MGLDILKTNGDVGPKPRRAIEAAAGVRFEWEAAVHGLTRLPGEELARETVLGAKWEGLAAVQ